MSNIGLCRYLSVSISCVMGVIAFTYNSNREICDTSTFISDTAGVLASVVSAVACTAIALGAREAGLRLRCLTIAAACMSWSAVVLSVASDVVMGRCAFGDNSLRIENSYFIALMLQGVSLFMMTIVMAGISQLEACFYGVIFYPFKKVFSVEAVHGSKLFMETVV